MPADVAQKCGVVAEEITSLKDEEFIAKCLASYAENAAFRAAINEDNRRQYVATGDPLRAWYTYLLARETKQPVPEWVMSYLDTVACGLLYDQNKLADCALHLGFNLKDGGSSPFKQTSDLAMREMAVVEVGRRLATPGKTVEDACTEVAQWLFDFFGKKAANGEPLDGRTIFKWYYKSKKPYS